MGDMGGCMGFYWQGERDPGSGMGDKIRFGRNYVKTSSLV